MKAWVIHKTEPISLSSAPLACVDAPRPTPGPGEILIKVSVCGICHTELDEIEGRTPPSSFPRIPGHQVVGIIEEHGPGTGRLPRGMRVGVSWLFSACGTCAQCKGGNENLCPDFKGTGRDSDGGYAEFMTVPEAFAVPIPDTITDTQAAPLLCAGAVGYRSLSLANIDTTGALGFTGFGASAHLVLHMAMYRFPGLKTAVFARSESQQAFALELGADWAGGTTDKPPFKLTAIIDTTPAWKPVISALDVLEPGGRLVINAIRKEAGDKERLMELDYARHLWMEKEIKSVANVTRNDVEHCLRLAAEANIQPKTQSYPFSEANNALCELKAGNSTGAKVLIIH